MSAVSNCAPDIEALPMPLRTLTSKEERPLLGPMRSWTSDFALTYSRSSFGPRISLPQRNPSSSWLRRRAEKKLCGFGHGTVIAVDAKWGMHHSSYEALQRSVEEDDCRLCSQLWRDVSSSGEDPSSLIWPLYRWTIRDPQRIGDSEEVYAAIAFRKAISMTSPNAKQNPKVSLPERTSLLFQQSDPERMQPLDALGWNTFSEEAQTRIRQWISDCNEAHPDCQGRADPDFMPTRLLDLERGERIYVVETRPGNIRAP
ncbi:hypothetical protein CC80DRAFT_544450 [Byssothecium circinans]|uniref:Uncharacterized protein n=1 Tax=Byssothecium circinans TaxID=147558 RepID=A0A6A5UFX6_9PLEO|nr:hypothetical protein CC80DRAFT_544450 [Byssothecium circinans]